ncbi:hypothetical protein CXG81DRAFT_25241 [Caulochytrium protostelioides]|uniref:NAA35-like TPR repeats domain-containing protein n=1 Tax=Caulochytrium protostelioides TaxID=1555241 RepID=A0A4P9X9U9_9FUNG|nr:hypothetical protein CXG81DRAFT_25241 [Caulochytrium protostelioides]|eukprot:RKP02085.1 hypothetical protein CXG81DRAFT_25241 [Caulochytrium protostelioides]
MDGASTPSLALEGQAVLPPVRPPPPPPSDHAPPSHPAQDPADLTDVLHAACRALPMNAILRADSAPLTYTMNAVALMDPNVDTGMRLEAADAAALAATAPDDPTYADIAWQPLAAVCDVLAAQLDHYIVGVSMLQTVHASPLTASPLTLGNDLLRSVVMAVLQCTDHVRRQCAMATTFKLEEFDTECGGLPMGDEVACEELLQELGYFVALLSRSDLLDGDGGASPERRWQIRPAYAPFLPSAHGLPADRAAATALLRHIATWLRFWHAWLQSLAAMRQDAWSPLLTQIRAARAAYRECRRHADRHVAPAVREAVASWFVPYRHVKRFTPGMSAHPARLRETARAMAAGADDRWHAMLARIEAIAAYLKALDDAVGAADLLSEVRGLQHLLTWLPRRGPLTKLEGALLESFLRPYCYSMAQLMEAVAVDYLPWLDPVRSADPDGPAATWLPHLVRRVAPLFYDYCKVWCFNAPRRRRRLIRLLTDLLDAHDPVLMATAPGSFRDFMAVWKTRIVLDILELGIACELYIPHELPTVFAYHAHYYTELHRLLLAAASRSGFGQVVFLHERGGAHGSGGGGTAPVGEALATWHGILAATKAALYHALHLAADVLHACGLTDAPPTPVAVPDAVYHAQRFGLFHRLAEPPPPPAALAVRGVAAPDAIAVAADAVAAAETARRGLARLIEQRHAATAPSRPPMATSAIEGIVGVQGHGDDVVRASEQEILDAVDAVIGENVVSMARLHAAVGRLPWDAGAAAVRGAARAWVWQDPTPALVYWQLRSDPATPTLP